MNPLDPGSLDDAVKYYGSLNDVISTVWTDAATKVSRLCEVTSPYFDAALKIRSYSSMPCLRAMSAISRICTLSVHTARMLSGLRAIKADGIMKILTSVSPLHISDHTQASTD